MPDSPDDQCFVRYYLGGQGPLYIGMDGTTVTTLRTAAGTWPRHIAHQKRKALMDKLVGDVTAMVCKDYGMT